MELTPHHVEQILDQHRQFFNTHQTKNLNFRLLQLGKLKRAIQKFESQILDALQQDLGKHEFEAYATEVGYVLSSLTHTIRHLKQWARPKTVKTPITLFPAKSQIRYEPYGTALIMGPFNYPFQLLIEPLIGAIAAGNCAVLKPSELVPHTAEVVDKMIKATFPQHYIRCVAGAIETNTSLINAPFDYIFFTGSVPVGKIVMEAAAKNLVPVTLELGGKSPVIVAEDANIKAAARRIVWGKIVNGGQTCVAPDYLLVHEAVKKPLLDEMVRVLEKFYKNGYDHMGRIVSDRHFNRLTQIIEKEKDAIIFGGDSESKSRFIQPTLLEANWNSPSMEEELFGPILPIITFKNLDEAIANINKHPKPLALYLFTTSQKTEQKVLQHTSAGGVCINNTMLHLVGPNLPFGGVGPAGIGSYHGIYSFKTFSHEKSILKSPASFELSQSLTYPPYTKAKTHLIRKFLR